LGTRPHRAEQFRIVGNASAPLGTAPHHADAFRKAMSINIALMYAYIALVQRASPRCTLTSSRGRVPSDAELFRKAASIDGVTRNSSAWCGAVPHDAELLPEARTRSARRCKLTLPLGTLPQGNVSVHCLYVSTHWGDARRATRKRYFEPYWQ